MMAQVVVGLDSRIYQVNLLTGHNNDQGAFSISGVRHFIEENNIKLLADGGRQRCSYS